MLIAAYHRAKRNGPEIFTDIYVHNTVMHGWAKMVCTEVSLYRIIIHCEVVNIHELNLVMQIMLILITLLNLQLNNLTV